MSIKSKSTAIIALLAVLAADCSAADRDLKSYLGFSFSQAQLDDYLQSRMEQLKIPGLAIALINRGSVVYHRTFGYANVQEKRPVAKETIFEGASISKSVFGFFAMQYVEDGRLDLDRPLYEYLPHPDLADDERHKKITARMALSHRSGLPNWREDEPDKKLRIKFEPGTAYEYSGEGYQYLAMVLCAIEETDWAGLEAVFQAKVAGPLGLEHTVFIQTPHTRARKAEPYDKDGNWIDWENDYWRIKGQGVFGAAYSIHSEPVDFSKWMIAVMNGELLAKESYDVMLRPHSEVPQSDIDIWYTLGFMKYPFPLADTYGHGGDNEGFTSFYTLDTEQDWGYVLFTNSEYGQQLGGELFFEFLMLGPDLTLPALVGGAIVLIVLAGIVLVVRLFIKRLARASR